MSKQRQELDTVKHTTELDSKLLTDVRNSIVVIRDMPVIADADVANLYGVETKRVNEAVRNNPDKFPEDYMFVLSSEESAVATILKSRSALNVTFAIIETFTQVRNLKRELIDLHKETDSEKQTAKMRHFGKVLSDIVMPDLETSETESTLELNFFIGKIKHTVKRVRKSSAKNASEEDEQ